MKKKPLKVFASGIPAGAISRSDIEPDTFLFTYSLMCPGTAAVSLTMPVVPDQYDSMGMVHPVFEMNLPEGQLRHRLEMMFAKAVRDFDSLSLLEIVGKSQIGRLRYVAEDVALEDVPGQSVQQLLAYQGAEDLFDDLLNRFASHSGISGMQPKVLIRDELTNLDRITDKGATHIVKSFNPREYHELAANEYFSMLAARHAGLPTANTKLSDNRSMLVVERFDRTEAGSYLGCEDFCVLSGMRSSGRYSSSYEVLARRIATYVSPEHAASAMQQYFGTVALSCAIRNGDAHLKNFAVLYDRPGENVRLAPVYDMLSTTPYLPRDVLALELDGSKAFPSRKQLIQFGRQSCGLSSRQVTAILERVESGVGQSLREMHDYAIRHSDFSPTAERLTTIFLDGLEATLSD